MTRKPPSTRASSHLFLQCGLLNTPISVYSATDSGSGVKRNGMFQSPVMEDDGNGGQRQKVVVVENEDGTKTEVPVFEDHPTGIKKYDKVTGEVLEDGADVQMKVKTEYGYVFVDEHEEEALFDVPPRSLVVDSFQPLALWHSGHYVPTGIKFVEPGKVQGKGGKKVASETVDKALVLILEAMREEGVFALCEWTDRGTSKWAALLPDGRLYPLAFDDDLRTQRPLPEVELADAELAMGRQLVQTLTTTEPKDLPDTKTQLILAFAEDKARAGDFGRSEDTYVEKEMSEEDAGGLLALLAASVEQAEAKVNAS